jgi:glutaredoxin
MAARARPHLVVYTREGCPLCDEMIAGLTARGLTFGIRDVDADARARARYGLKVPVLTVNGDPVCSGRLDEDLVAELLGE